MFGIRLRSRSVRLLLNGAALIVPYVFVFVQGQVMPTAAFLAAALWAPLVLRLHRLHLGHCGDHATARDSLPANSDKLAQIGRWTIERPSGRHHWSDEMCQIAGVPPGTVPSHTELTNLLGDGWKQLQLTLASHCHDREPFRLEFEVCDANGGRRMLRARAKNVLGRDGNCTLVQMAVRDATDEHRQLETAAQQRSEALALAREALVLADTDPLTGLANRRHFMREMDQLVMTMRTSGEPLSLVLFDIDHFKAVNDRHGHQVGDVVLRKVAELARTRVRSTDLLARIGGEEFIWLLPGADAPVVAEVAERLRWTIEAGTLSAPFPAVTVSVGYVTMGPADTTLSLFARADAALYQAKNTGRNRVRHAA